MQLMSLFSEEGAASTASSAATSAATSAAENAALAQAGSSAASVTAAGQSAIAAQGAAASSGSLLQYINQGATLLQGIAGFQSGNANANNLSAAAKQARYVGAANKNIMDARGRAQLGELKAQMGAQGTTFSGSPMLVYLDSVRNAAIESQNAYYQGATQAANYKAQSKLTRAGAQDSLFSGILAAAAPSVGGSLGSRLLRKP
jgi:hypothetical protein